MLLQTLGWLPVSVLGHNWSLGCPAQMEISALKKSEESNLLNKEIEGLYFCFPLQDSKPFRMLLFWVAQHFSRQGLCFSPGYFRTLFPGTCSLCLAACHGLTGLLMAGTGAVPFCHLPSSWEGRAEFSHREGGRHGPWEGNGHSIQ